MHRTVLRKARIAHIFLLKGKQEIHSSSHGYYR